MDGKRVFLFPGLILGRCRDLRHGGVGSGTLRESKGLIGVSQSPAPPPTLRRQEVAVTQHNPGHLEKVNTAGEHPWDPARSCPGHQSLPRCVAPCPARPPRSCCSSLIIARLAGGGGGRSRRVCHRPGALQSQGHTLRVTHTQGDTPGRCDTQPCPARDLGPGAPHTLGDSFPSPSPAEPRGRPHPAGSGGDVSPAPPHRGAGGGDTKANKGWLCPSALPRSGHGEQESSLCRADTVGLCPCQPPTALGPGPAQTSAKPLPPQPRIS